MLQRVVKKYMIFIGTGKPVTGFEEFLLPVFRTDETIEQMRASGCGYV